MKDGRRISPTRALLGAAGALLFAVLVPPAAAAADGPPGPPADPIKHLYRTYVPPYVDPNGNTLTRHYRRRLYLELKPTREHMRLSTEKAFYSLSTIHREDRANALIEAAITKERQEQYRAALKMYQIVIDRFPDALYRVSDYGVFVPVAQYAQRRILQFPRPALEHYQTLHDPRAKEAFEQARRRYSLIGFSQIVDRMMATSYGDDALLELGNAALDQGHYLEALEHFGTIREYFRRSELLGEELDLRIRLCRKLLGGSPGGAEGSAADAPTPTVGKLRRIVQGAAADRPPYDEQRASAPHTAADDYVCFPPTDDPLGLADPVWKVGLPASRGKVRVFYQPVVTRDSVIYRHMNIVYCRSILNGELRWKNDLGGRVSWQNRGERQYPNEDVLVQDGLVFAPMHKVGPSLVALDEVTGQLRWAHGPVTASTLEEARMRFEAAPAGGPRTVYAGYVLDNIEGAAHTDTEYGVIAFESATGRVRWQRTLCRLAPGEFMAGFAVSRRNRIKSFTSPPLYHEGTVYYGTNAGVVVALDARSGRIKWLMRYPYWPKVHDAGRPHGSTQRSARRGPHYPMPWFNQRPLLLGERLLVLPVDSPLLLCLDRETGKVMWSRAKGRDGGWRWDFGGYVWLLGPTRDGHLVYVASGRGSIIHLLDQETGKVVWTAPDPILRDDQPVMNHPGNVNRYYEGHVPGWGFNVRGFWLGARPFLSDDGQLVASYWIPAAYRHGIWCYALACYSLADRAVVDRRRYYTHSVLRQTRRDIAKAKELLQVEKEIRRKRNAKQKRRLQMLKEIAADHVPVNRYGPFVPFARMTFRRYGVRFEMRMRARSLTMRYDPALLNRKLAARGDPGAEFAKAELDLANGRLDDTARRLNHCLATISSEDLDFRATINQILYQVHKRLARSAIRAKDPEAELEQALGMNRTAGTLHDEIETLFALADAFARKGDPAAAARALRSIVTTYGHYEHPIPAICSQREEAIAGAASEVFDRARRYVDPELFRKEFERTLGLLERSLPLYFSAVSPLPKDVKVRAGDRAVRKLLAIQEQFADFADRYERTAKRELAGMSPAEQQYHMWEFPGTAAAQAALDDLFARAAKAPGPEGRQRFWQLADLARVCRLTVPQALRRRVDAPPPGPRRRPLAVRREPRTLDFEDAEGTKLLVLKRRGERKRHPGLLFLGGRTRKRLDNKFVLICVDLEEGEVLWRGRERRGDRWFEEIRLKGKGAEPGFSEAFVCGDLVVVHGLYDVLAFGVGDGRLRWRYRAPFDFEIKHARMSGELLVLAGKTETIALYIPSESRAGEVAWRQKEQGDLYIAPYFQGDRLISVRKLPFSVTARYRLTGKLIGRLALPALSLHPRHPLFEETDPLHRQALPVARDGDLLVVTDGWYYIAVDTRTLTVRWKRLIDNNDVTREPAMRFELGGDYLAILKNDYDQDAIYMLSSRTGRVLWHTDPKDAHSPQPLYSLYVDAPPDGRGQAVLYGFGKHPGQGFYVVGRDCRTGKRLFKQEHAGYDGRPKAWLMRRGFGPERGGAAHLVARVQDRQEFELKALDASTGAAVRTLHREGIGPFGVHGRVSATVQNGRLVLLAKGRLNL